MSTKRRLSEADLYPKVRRLVEEYGELTTQELKNLLIPILEEGDLDEEDLEILHGRTDTKLSQKIRNIGAHAEQNEITYKPGFAIDKTGSEIVYRPLIGTNGIPSDKETEAIKQRGARYRAKKIDYAKKTERDSFVGLAGEQFVMTYEQNRLKDILDDFNPTVDVYHLSQVEGDGAGYDILSKNSDRSSRYIEVKTTTQKATHPFYMSTNEWEFMKEHQDNAAYIYRVYNFSTDTMSGEIDIISASDLLEKYRFDCVTFRVSPKEILDETVS